MHKDHDVFIQSLGRETKLKLTFFSRKHASEVVSSCAPLHYGKGPAGLAPSAEDELECYYLWDFGAKRGSNFLALSASQIVSMEPTEDVFHVQEFYRQSNRAEKPTKSSSV